jgi:hypothetical protein
MIMTVSGPPRVRLLGVYAELGTQAREWKRDTGEVAQALAGEEREAWSAEMSGWEGAVLRVFYAGQEEKHAAFREAHGFGPQAGRLPHAARPGAEAVNRRGFLGSVAGAVVGGTFRRLAPAAAPVPLEPGAFYGIHRGVDPRPTSDFIEAACREMDMSMAALRAQMAKLIQCPDE